MKTSLPEKTLEHWLSQYILYRYKSKASLWWPTKGEDIQAAPARIGKSIQLEVKTAYHEPSNPSVHHINIDVPQLKQYFHRPLHLQPFYVFPVPDWEGELIDFAHKHALEPTELAFRRAESGGWFAERQVVMTTLDVVQAFGGFQSLPSTRVARLASIHLETPGRRRLPWLSPKIEGPLTTVRDRVAPWVGFWTDLGQCGKPDWPQSFHLQSDFVHSGARLDRSDVLRALLSWSNSSDHIDSRDQQVTVVGDVRRGPELVWNKRQAVFKAVEPAYYDNDRSDDEQTPEERRIGAFLSVSALKLG